AAPMRRLHLIEFEDLSWFPRVLREIMTDDLSLLGEMGRVSYAGFVPRLAAAMAATGEHRLIDLCTGGGGPAWTIASLLGEGAGRPVEVTLTDLYPNGERLARLVAHSGGRARYATESVDATRVPPALSGFRLLCNGFHHFRPDDARAILHDAVEQRRGI